MSDTPSAVAPLLSIIVPSLNQGDFIGRCLQSIDDIGDEYRYLVEVLVLDGGSIDQTMDVVRQYVRIVSFSDSGPDGGQAAAINRGFGLASGRWLAFQNSDDYYDTAGLKASLDLLKSATSEVDLIQGGTLFTNLDGTTIHVSLPKPMTALCLCARNFMQNQSLFVRRDLLTNAGALNSSLQFCLDYDWFIRLLRCSTGKVYLYRVVGVQLMHPDTKTAKFQDLHDRERQTVRKHYFSRFQRAESWAILPIYGAFRKAYALYRLIQ